jgi:hypothetical protein
VWSVVAEGESVSAAEFLSERGSLDFDFASPASSTARSPPGLHDVPLCPQVPPEDDAPQNVGDDVLKRGAVLNSWSPNSVAYGVINVLVPICFRNMDEDHASRLQEEVLAADATSVHINKMERETRQSGGESGLQSSFGSSSLDNWDVEEPYLLVVVCCFLVFSCI